MTAADAVMVIHLGVVVFNASLLVLVPWGRSRWHWVRHRLIRQLHLLMMFFIAIQTLLGHHCPLTLLEASLRHEQIEGLFFARMIHAFLFWDLPLSVFATLYLVCLIWAITLWFLVPPYGRSVSKDVSPTTRQGNGASGLGPDRHKPSGDS